MVFQKGNKMGGRPKGVPNRATLIEAGLEASFKKIGGGKGVVPELVKLADSSDPKLKAIYWGLAGKLIRQKVESDVAPGGTLAEILTRVQAAGKPK